jgi:Bacterial Ig-like domain (group 2)
MQISIAMQKWLLSLLLVGVCLFVGCGGSSGSGPTPPPTTPTLTAITVTPANPAIALGTTQPTQQFAATGTYSDGSTKVLTSTANWVSSNPAVATVNTTGLATGMTAGTTTIGATSGTISGSTVLTVNPAPLVSITVTPATMTVAPNGTQQFTATGKYADGSTQNITSSVTWSASLGATITTGGLATGVTPNTTSTIMAAQGNISGTATLTITNPLVSIAVTPPTASIAQQTTQQFVATGTYADQSTQILTASVTWNSSNPTIATISNSQGMQGLATSLTTAGTTMITATMGTVTSPAATLTVTSAILVSIAVTPPNPQIVYQTQQPFVATGTYSDSSTQIITGNVTWASSDTTKITITTGGQGGGIATGVNTTTSPVTISATKGTVVGSTTATVVPAPVVSIAITPAAPTSLAMGTSRQYTATATLANGSTLNVTNVATWTSLNTAVATVGTHSGVVKAATTVMTPTTVMFTVSYNSVTQTFSVDVTNATVSAITVTPITPSIPAGVQQRFIAIATFSDSTTQDISQNATWNSSNTGIATVNSAGIAFGVSPVRLQLRQTSNQ